MITIVNEKNGKENRMNKSKTLELREKIRDMLEQGNSIPKVAKALGISSSTIRYHLQRGNIIDRTKSTRTVIYTVGALIAHLEKLGRERLLIGDADGNTYNLTDDDICLWNPSDPESPVVIFDSDNWV